MLNLKTPQEIKTLQEGGHKLAQILNEVVAKAKVGISGQKLDKLAEELIIKAGGRPSFKNHEGFPAALCISVNQTIVHGIPTDKAFEEGDLVGIDIGMKYKGLYTDMARTVGIAKISDKAQKLLKLTKESLAVGIAQVAPGKDIADIGKAIENFIKPHNYGIVRSLTGHGVGHKVHEEPKVPNFTSDKPIAVMKPGLVIAIEPMIVMGGDHRLTTAKNGWDAISLDGSLTAHFEHTVAVTDKGHVIITK